MFLQYLYHLIVLKNVFNTSLLIRQLLFSNYNTAVTQTELHDMIQRLAHHAHQTRFHWHVNQSMANGWSRRIQKLKGFEKTVDRAAT